MKTVNQYKTIAKQIKKDAQKYNLEFSRMLMEDNNDLTFAEADLVAIYADEIQIDSNFVSEFLEDYISESRYSTSEIEVYKIILEEIGLRILGEEKFLNLKEQIKADLCDPIDAAKLICTKATSILGVK